MHTLFDDTLQPHDPYSPLQVEARDVFVDIQFVVPSVSILALINVALSGCVMNSAPLICVLRLTSVPFIKSEDEVSTILNVLATKLPADIVALIGAPGPLAVKLPASKSVWDVS